MKTSTKKSAKIILGIAGAVAAGVAIGMLVAPKKGSESRSMLKNSAEKWAGNLNRMMKKKTNHMPKESKEPVLS